MDLQTIEKIVLAQIGFTRYSTLSVSTNADDIEDFATLHNCITLAREDIKINAFLPEVYTGTSLTTVADQVSYSLPTNFDLPIIIYYIDSNSNIRKLDPLAVQDTTDLIYGLVTGLPGSTSGNPTAYIIASNSANLIQISMSPAPERAGELIVPVYKPVLTELTTATDEDVIMKKYPKAVLNFAIAHAFQIFKKDQNSYDKYYAYGISDCQKINLRQLSADPNPAMSIDNFLKTKRQGRNTI